MGTGELIGAAFTGCVHKLEVWNYKVGGEGQGQGGHLEDGGSFGQQVDFSDPHLNKKSRGVVSSEECILTTRTTTTTTTTTTTRDIVMRDVAFDGESYLHLWDDVVPLQKLDRFGVGDLDLVGIDIDVTAIKQEGVLFWMGERKMGVGQFAALEVKRGGYLELQLDFGDGIKRGTSYGSLGEDLSHKVSLQFTMSRAKVIMDGRTEIDLQYGNTVFPRSNAFIGNAGKRII